MKRALEAGELEHDLALETAGRRMKELGDGMLVLVVGTLVAEA